MDALILSCGGSIDPLIKSIIKYRPDLIYFLHSEDSLVNVFEIISFFEVLERLSLFDFHLRYKFKLIKEYQDIEQVFAVSNEMISQLQKESYDVRIDFTGGTKPMSAGLILASIGNNCKYSYIGSKNSNGREKNGVGAVKGGFELVIEQNDPYESYAIFEFERGKEFFDEYQFKAAKLNFENAKNKTKSKELKELAGIYIKIVEIYDLWDKFEIKKSKNTVLYHPFKKEILNKINDDENLYNHFSQNYPKFLRQIENNIEFLEKKISYKKGVNVNNISYYLPDLLNNAQRRIDEGKYDDAVARLYRAIELIAQIKLAREGYIDEKILLGKVFKIKKSEIENLPEGYKIKHLIKSWPEYDDSNNVFKVGLFKNYCILACLNFDFAKKYLKDKDIQNNVDLRNGSILAHGLNRIKDEKAKDLINQVLTYARYVCPSVDELMQQAKFPKFKEK